MEKAFKKAMDNVFTFVDTAFSRLFSETEIEVEDTSTEERTFRFKAATHRERVRMANKFSKMSDDMRKTGTCSFTLKTKA